MRGVLHWLRRIGLAAAREGKSGRREFVVERLEPRQMLAADCLFLVEIGPAEPADGGHIAEEYCVPSWHAEGSLWNDSIHHATDVAEVSLLGDFEDVRLIFLEELIEEIGELYEVQEASFGEIDYGDFGWFS